MQSPHTASRLLPLTVALEHPALSTDPRVLCAAAQACKAWRGAVQQCSACNTDVVIDLNASLIHVISFCDWLCHHAALVRSVSVSADHLQHDVSIHGLQQEVHYTAAQRLQQSLQLATAPSTSSMPALPPAAAAAAAAPAKQQQQGLRLGSFSSSCFEKPGTIGMLAALPAHSLTHLDLTVDDSTTLDGARMSAALARLSCLQQLQLSSGSSTYGVQVTGGSCLANVVQLSQLTSLKVGGSHWCGSDAELQQALAQPLPLRQLHLNDVSLELLPAVDVSRMTQLMDLALVDCEARQELVLPAQLQQLGLEVWRTPNQLSALMPLQQLRRLQLLHGFVEQQPLLWLAQLPALQHLTLHYYDQRHAAKGAASWAQLPQLKGLHITLHDQVPLPRRMAAILSGVAACSGLTTLQLHALEEDNANPDAACAVAVCDQLACLRTLQDLCINECSYLVPGDAWALTSLTGLTRLVLNDQESGVGDVAATALACSLRQLRNLQLQNCDLGAMVCLAAIGQLTQLTELQLQDNSGLTREGLMLLTGLTRLQQLGVTKSAEVTDAVVQEFWAAVKQQQ